MSDDPTKNLTEKYDTKPTLETVVQILGELRQHMDARFEAFEERIGVRLDRIESEVKQTHSELLTLRADFVEFRAEVRERLKETA